MIFPLFVVGLLQAAAAAAFVPPVPRATAAAAAAAAADAAGAVLSERVDTRVFVASDAAGSGDGRLPLPPRDETFGLRGRFRELLAAPDAVDDAERYDRVGGLSGGIWRSLSYGVFPSTVITFQEGSKWIVQQEANGAVYQSWPRSIIEILGKKALTNLSEQPKVHSTARKPLSEALSPKSVLELQPFLNVVLGRLMLRLEGFVESGQEIAMLDLLSVFTLEAIAGVYFGDYATPDLIGDVKRYMRAISSGLFSIPVRLPWPINKLPVLSFGKSMDARKALSGEIRRVLEERRADMLSVGEGSSGTGGKNAGVLDSLIELQWEQGGTFDDDFIVDMVIGSLYGGTDTTAVTLARILQLLATAGDGKEIVARLLQELGNEATSDDDELDDTKGTGKGGASREGILRAFPLLDAVVLEAFRVHPPVNSVFRKTKKDLTYNGYLIPGGESINWNSLHQMRATSLYPSPKKFCPFRFLHGDKSEDGRSAASTSPAAVFVEQPIPPMFGFGRHMCPGRELAKLEMLMFLRAFLSKFDYELVEGQSFKGVLPTNAPKDKLRVILKPRPGM